MEFSISSNFFDGGAGAFFSSTGLHLRFFDRARYFSQWFRMEPQVLGKQAWVVEVRGEFLEGKGLVADNPVESGTILVGGVKAALTVKNRPGTVAKGGEPAEFVARSNVPHTHGAIPAARDEPLAVGAERHARDPVFVSAEGTQFLAAGQVPEANAYVVWRRCVIIEALISVRSFAVGRDEPLVVGTESHGRDGTVVSAKDADARAALQAGRAELSGSVVGFHEPMLGTAAVVASDKERAVAGQD
jgi:hypothetical protein